MADLSPLRRSVRRSSEGALGSWRAAIEDKKRHKTPPQENSNSVISSPLRHSKVVTAQSAAKAPRQSFETVAKDPSSARSASRRLSWTDFDSLKHGTAYNQEQPSKELQFSGTKTARYSISTTQKGHPEDGQETLLSGLNHSSYHSGNYSKALNSPPDIRRHSPSSDHPDNVGSAEERTETLPMDSEGNTFGETIASGTRRKSNTPADRTNPTNEVWTKTTEDNDLSLRVNDIGYTLNRITGKLNALEDYMFQEESQQPSPAYDFRTTKGSLQGKEAITLSPQLSLSRSHTKRLTRYSSPNVTQEPGEMGDNSSSTTKAVQCDTASPSHADELAVKNDISELHARARNLVQEIQQYKQEAQVQERNSQRLENKLKQERKLRKKAEETMEEIAEQYQGLDTRYQSALESVKSAYEKEAMKAKRRAAKIIHQERDRTRQVMDELEQEIRGSNMSYSRIPVKTISSQQPYASEIEQDMPATRREPPEVAGKIPWSFSEKRVESKSDNTPQTFYDEPVEYHQSPQQTQPSIAIASSSGEAQTQSFCSPITAKRPDSNGEVSRIPISHRSAETQVHEAEEYVNPHNRSRVDDCFLVNFHGVYSIGGRRESDQWQ